MIRWMWGGAGLPTNVIRILRTFSSQIINPTSSLIPYNRDNLPVYNIRNLYCATLLSFFIKKTQYRICIDIRDMSSRCYHDQAPGRNHTQSLSDNISKQNKLLTSTTANSKRPSLYECFHTKCGFFGVFAWKWTSVFNSFS